MIFLKKWWNLEPSEAVSESEVFKAPFFRDAIKSIVVEVLSELGKKEV